MARTRATFRPLIREPPGNMPQHNPSDGGYHHQEEDTADAVSNSADLEAVDHSPNSQENGDDQEAEAEGGHENEENGYGTWRVDQDPNNSHGIPPGTSLEPSESEREIGKREQENDDETCVDHLMAWMVQMGLGKYTCLFKDLKDMGVREVGSRLKICRCIHELFLEFLLQD